MSWKGHYLHEEKEMGLSLLDWLEEHHHIFSLVVGHLLHYNWREQGTHSCSEALLEMETHNCQMLGPDQLVNCNCPELMGQLVIHWKVDLMNQEKATHSYWEQLLGESHSC